MIIIAAVVLLALIGTAAMVAVRSGRNSVIINNAPPESTVSGWDDSSPLPTSTPSTSATPSTDPGNDQQPCPYVDPDFDRLGSTDGRVRGGRLSYAQVTGGGFAEPSPGGQLGWVHDRSGQTALVADNWVARFEVGFIPARDGFRTPRKAAESSMQCLITNGGYPGFTRRDDLRDRRITVDGEPGWVLTANIHDREAPSFPGDRVTMIVVDDGSDRLLLWMAMVPIGDQERIRLSDRAEASLRVH